MEKASGSIGQSVNITVPSSAKEISIDANLGNIYSHVAFHIVTDTIPINSKNYYRGGHYNTSSDNQGITISIEHNSTGFVVGVANAYLSGVDKSSDVSGNVYYR